MKRFNIGGKDTFIGTAAERAAASAAQFKGQFFIEEDTAGGPEFFSNGTTWVQTGTAGAGIVTDIVGAGSVYNADKSVTNASQNEAIPAGARSVTIKNISGTATDVMRFRMGSDNSVTATTSTGFHLLAGEQSPPIPILDGQTWWAWIGNNAVAFNASVVWGF